MEEQQDESGAGADLASVHSPGFTGICFTSAMCLIIV